MLDELNAIYAGAETCAGFLCINGADNKNNNWVWKSGRRCFLRCFFFCFLLQVCALALWCLNELHFAIIHSIIFMSFKLVTSFIRLLVATFSLGDVFTSGVVMAFKLSYRNLSEIFYFISTTNMSWCCLIENFYYLIFFSIIVFTKFPHEVCQCN